MSPAIGIALFVIGVAALLLSILMDRRPPSRQPAPDAASDAGSEAPDEGRASHATVEPEVAMVAEPDLATEPSEREPAPIAPELAASTTVPGADLVETVAGGPEPAPSDRVTAAEARLEKLRAEFVAVGPQAEAAAPEPAATPEPAPVIEPSARSDAGRVFAAVASVGRDPQEERPEPSSSAEPEPTAVLEPEPVASASESPEGPGLVAAPEPAAEVGHGHAIPIVSHSDLVSHLRREHPDLEYGGSTIQMRRLHDGVHAS